MTKKETLYNVRWTGEQPRQSYLDTLDLHFIREPKNKKQEIANSRLLYSHVSGWAFSRYHLEDQLVRGVLTEDDRAKAIEWLEKMAPWPTDVNPCGIAPDYYPLELA